MSCAAGNSRARKPSTAGARLRDSSQQRRRAPAWPTSSGRQRVSSRYGSMAVQAFSQLQRSRTKRRMGLERTRGQRSGRRIAKATDMDQQSVSPYDESQPCQHSGKTRWQTHRAPGVSLCSTHTAYLRCAGGKQWCAEAASVSASTYAAVQRAAGRTRARSSAWLRRLWSPPGSGARREFNDHLTHDQAFADAMSRRLDVVAASFLFCSYTLCAILIFAINGTLYGKS